MMMCSSSIDHRQNGPGLLKPYRADGPQNPGERPNVHRDARFFGHAPTVLLLSEMTGQDVLGPDGRVAGRVADLTVRLGEHAGQHLVERLLVRRRRAPDLLLPWTEIESFESTCVMLRDPLDPTSFMISSATEALGADEILLVRDVIDTQIIDIADQRLARVADVVLTRTATDRLELVGVEVGFGGVLRRLGLHRLAARAHEDVVTWTDLHLTSERGHAVQLATPRSAVHHLDAAGLAALVSKLDTDSATEVLTAAGPSVAADVVGIAHPIVGERVLRAMPDADAAQIVAAMPQEHATRWRKRLAHSPVLLGRRFIRSGVWPRRSQSRAANRAAP
jgi:sporulation protein YlmC with PRC-barrel domain